MEHSLENS